MKHLPAVVTMILCLVTPGDRSFDDATLRSPAVADACGTSITPSAHGTACSACAVEGGDVLAGVETDDVDGEADGAHASAWSAAAVETPTASLRARARKHATTYAPVAERRPPPSFALGTRPARGPPLNA